MKEIKIYNEEIDLEISFNIKDSWEEVTLKEYVDLANIINQKENMEDEEFLLSILQIVSDATREKLSDIPVSEFNNLTDAFSIYTNISVDDTIKDYYIIEDKIFVPKKNMSNLTITELVYIKQIQKEKDLFNVYLGMLSILLRPGYKKENDGKDRWIMHKLNEEDIEDRRNYFRDKLSSAVAIPLIKAFMSGTKE